MKTKSPSAYKPNAWSQSGRPIQPYRFDPVAIVDSSEIASMRNPNGGLVDAKTQPYLTDSIHTEVLKLGQGRAFSFVRFAEEIGLHEFLEWALDEATSDQHPPNSFSLLVDLLERYDTGFRQFTRQELAAAWTSLPGYAIRHKTEALRHAFAFAKRHKDDPLMAIRGVLGRAWETGVLRLILDIDESTDDPVIFERPKDIWARAWFELIQDLQEGRIVKACVVHGTFFVPKKRNRKYCSEKCRITVYDRKRSRDPKRREYQRERYLKRKEAQTQSAGIEHPDGSPPALKHMAKGT